MLNHALLYGKSTLKATENLHVNSQDGFSWPCCAFKSRLPLWIVASVIVTWQDVSSSHPGNTFQQNMLRAPFFLWGCWSVHKPSGACLFLDSPHADCIVTDLISIEKFEETLLG